MQNEFYIQWHITNQCRNRCLHCYQSKYNGENVTLDQTDFILANITECGAELDAIPYILITGGDPIENPHFFEILERSLKISNRVGILGNPEPIISNDKDILGRMVDLKIDSYQVSLDGLEKTHDTWRRKGSFQRTLRAIELLNEAGVWVNVMSTVSKENYKEMVDVMNIAYKHGANFWTFTRYAPPNGGHCGIKAEDFTIFMKEITEALKPYEAKGKPTQTREPLLCQIEELDHPERLGGCGVGFSRMALLPDNTLMACRRHPGSILGKVDHEHSILWHFVMNPKMDKYRDFLTIKGCSKCDMLNQCRGCRAIAYLATNDEDGDDPQCLFLQKERKKVGIADKNYFVACNTPFGVKCS